MIWGNRELIFEGVLVTIAQKFRLRTQLFEFIDFFPQNYPISSNNLNRGIGNTV